VFDAGEREKKHPQKDPCAHSKKADIENPPLSYVPAEFIGERFKPAEKLVPEPIVSVPEELYHLFFTSS